jgi:hypothetical protein
VTDLLATLRELEHLDVGFVSLTEALDLTTPAGRAMAGLLAIFSDNAERAIMQSHSVRVPIAVEHRRETRSVFPRISRLGTSCGIVRSDANKPFPISGWGTRPSEIDRACQ